LEVCEQVRNLISARAAGDLIDCKYENVRHRQAFYAQR